MATTSNRKGLLVFGWIRQYDDIPYDISITICLFSKDIIDYTIPRANFSRFLKESKQQSIPVEWSGDIVINFIL